ncbi:MAG: hypothetical protein M0023_13850 [Desulfobacteraceae bacterium]|nr:hypothetical protein [Desulfobacteraceae bacterium]
MKYVNKFLFAISLSTLFYCGLSPFDGVAFSAATIPVVTTLPVIKEGAVTPTRIAQDSLGNIYVTDPHAEGILKYDSVGKLLQKITTAKEPGGIAFAKNGDLLVTQGTYVAALDPVTYVEKRQIGSFLYAFSIAVDDRPTGTGNIFVSDIKNYVVQVFNDSYADVDVSAGTGHNPYRATNSVYRANFIGDNQLNYFAGGGFFNRPAGVAIEKQSGMLAVVDSLNGIIKFFNQNGDIAGQIGQFGYDANHQFVMLTYPQSIAFEYDAGGNLYRAYILDTFQSYVLVLDATNAFPGWTWLAEIGQYGHANGNLIVPSDIFIDKKDPANNRLLVSNGFGSLSVFGLSSLQPYNVVINSITNSSLKVNWTNASSAALKFIRVYRSTVEGQLGTNVSGNLSSSTTNFVDSPLAQYTTYYYTVRAVDQANVETTNISQVAAKTTGMFNLSVNISGNGQVNGTVSCTSGTCPSSQPSDALITLTATPFGQSVFTAWTGDCFTTADTCQVTMDSAKFVTAMFTAKLAFRVDGAYFDNLQDAYREAKDGSVIKVLAGTWPSTTHATEYMTAWQAKTVTIEGGYDATFTNNDGGSSTAVGRANLTAGKVIMKQFKLK